MTVAQTAPPRRWVPIEEAATYAGCTRRTLDRRIADGRLTRYRNGKKVMLDLNDIDAMFEASAGATFPRVGGDAS